MPEIDHTWDLVDAVAHSPLLGEAQIKSGIDLAEVERALLRADHIPVANRERLIAAARELANAYLHLSAEVRPLTPSA